MSRRAKPLQQQPRAEATEPRKRKRDEPSHRVAATNGKRPSAHHLDLRPNEWEVTQFECLDIVRAASKHSVATMPELSIASDAPNTLIDTDHDFLRAFLHPLTEKQFHSNYFARRALAIVGGGDARVMSLIADELGDLDPRFLMSKSPGESIFVWMKESSDSASGYRTLRSFPLDNPSQIDAALTCYNAGSSLYFRAPRALSRVLVRALTAGIGMNFAGLFDDHTEKGEVETFLSRAGHVTDYHCDFQENFTIQLAGSKTWHFKESSLVHPLRGVTPHYADNSTFETQQKVHQLCDPNFSVQSQRPAATDAGYSVTLRAGDVLFHPSGIWHRVECNEDSISVNVSLIATNYSDLVSDSIRQLLWRSQLGRRPVVGHDRQQVLDELQCCLESLSHTVKLLRASDIVPSSRWIPRTQRVLLDDRTEGETVSIDTSVKYQQNPLFVALAVSDDHPLSDNEEEDDDEQENEDEDGVSDGDRHDPAARVDPRAGLARFALHHGFGNEELTSAIRIALYANDAAAACVTAVVAAGANDAPWSVDTMKQSVPKQCRGSLHRVLAALLAIGFIRPFQP